jgi:hypothetical protein
MLYNNLIFVNKESARYMKYYCSWDEHLISF